MRIHDGVPGTLSGGAGDSMISVFVPATPSPCAALRTSRVGDTGAVESAVRSNRISVP